MGKIGIVAKSGYDVAVGEVNEDWFHRITMKNEGMCKFSQLKLFS